jgi:gamma-glutamyl:cysteine ligase YbdK (ATP-grasp superfamily)
MMLFWHRQLLQAENEEALVKVVNDFLASCTPESMAGLAEQCRPHRIHDVDDVNFWYQRLADAYCDAHAETSADHRQMLTFFVAAVAREHGLAQEATATMPFAQDATRRPSARM